MTSDSNGGWIDYWCNAFTPPMRARWARAIAGQGIPLGIDREEGDGFAEPEEMLARMDALGIAALLLPAAAGGDAAGETDYEAFATPPEHVAGWAARHPGRFAGLVTLDPTSGMVGVERAAETARRAGFVGLHVHTHSWDRPLDHRDYYPFYALAAELDLPVVLQAGASGGRMASECGRPIGIDRPALYFGDVRFVLSHTGWPWVDEALAMAGKHPNVYLGTASYPPNRWSDELVRFIDGAGRGKVLMGTSFPTVGHRQALTRLDGLDLAPEARTALLSGAARRVFTRLPAGER